MSETAWIFRSSDCDTDQLARNLKIPTSIAHILANRGIVEFKEAKQFLTGSLDDLFDPYLMPDMEVAVSRILKAAESGEKTIIFGDYDVDGVLSVVILSKALESMGLDVDYFIPDRLKDGYGIKEEYLRIVKRREASLVISVDCGIKADVFVREATKAGIDVIITDHHQPGELIPPALAVLNPVLPQSDYPDKNLAGIGVVFKLIQALLGKFGKGHLIPHYLKLVSIGTIADVVSLRNENRLFVKYGLKELENISNIGLRQLLEVSKIKGNIVNVGDVAFRIGPRINAAGRLGKADLSVRLFQSDSVEECRSIAQEMDGLNVQRQAVEKKIFDQVVERIESDQLNIHRKILVLGDEHWHRGVIGIVASKIKDRYHRPTLLFSLLDGKAFGSGRSIREFSLINCLEHLKEFFENYGGHPMAVGCEMESGKLEGLTEAANLYADRILRPEDLKRKIQIDTRLDLSEIDHSYLKYLSLLSPFGLGNPRPLFLVEKAELAADPKILQNRHLKLLVRQNGRIYEALGWGMSERASSLAQADILDLVFSLQRNDYMGEERFYLNLEDFKPASS